MARLLIDTTYLLPILGVKIELKEYEYIFPLVLRRYEVIYNPVSLIEAKWILLKLIKTHPEEAAYLLNSYVEGLATIVHSNYLRPTVLTNPKIEEVADKLFIEIKIKDYFDRIIYATAIYYNATLLTEDQTIKKIRHPEIPRPVVLSWRNIVSQFK